MIYFLGMFSMVVFAITGVIATRHQNLDIFSVVFLASVSALGGGTVRDVILGNYPVYWIHDLWFLWITVFTSFIAFFIVRTLSNRYQLLLYFDALGVALFSITAAEKTLTLGFAPSIAILMGLITAICGGLLRDILTGSPTLLLSKEMYATPVLLGLGIYVVLASYFPGFSLAVPVCIGFIFVFRACSIYYGLHYPKWLCNQ